MGSFMRLRPPFPTDLYDYDFENDPIDTLGRLRAEDPVHWSRHGLRYLDARREDCAAVLKDPVRFSSMAAGWGGANPLAQAKGVEGQSKTEQGLSRTLAQSFNQMDGADHARIRGLVVSAFSRRNIEERRGRIQGSDRRAAHHGRLAAKGQFDLITDFAFHLPIIVASEIIGIPADDREQFRLAFERGPGRS